MRRIVSVALCGAMMGVCLPEAQAQEVAPTAAGDVSASEATPLPPIDVISPSEPISKKKAGKAGKGSATGGTPEPTTTDGEGSATSDGTPGIFTLGQLDMIGGSTVGNKAMWTFNTNTLDQAAASGARRVHGQLWRPPQRA